MTDEADRTAKPDSGEPQRPISESTRFLGERLSTIQLHFQLHLLFIQAVANHSVTDDVADSFFALQQAEGKSPDPKHHADIKASITLAKTEAENGYPTLMSQSVVAMYANLEQTVRGFVARRIMERDRFLKRDALRKVRIRLPDVLDASPLDQAYAIVDAYETESGTRRSTGVERFDALLAILGVRPATTAETQQAIAELEALRHLIAHGQNTTDSRFCARCPWLRMSPGQPLPIHMDKFNRFAGAVSAYLISMMESLTAQRESRRKNQH